MSASEQPSTDPLAWEGWQTPAGVPDSEQMDLLTTDAATRAAAMLTGTDPAASGSLIDAVRMLAGPAGARHVDRAAELTGVPEDELRRLTLAYRHGGAAGAAAAHAATPCDAGEMAEAVGEVCRRRTFAIGELSVDPGTITDSGAGVRLRLGPDGRWYPFTLARQQWWPAMGASDCAGIAYQAAVRARSLRRATG